MLLRACAFWQSSSLCCDPVGRAGQPVRFPAKSTRPLHRHLNLFAPSIRHQAVFLRPETPSRATIEATFLAFEAEIQINRILVDELILQAPNPHQILTALQREVDSMSIERPADISVEQVVELRARAEQRLILLRKLIAASA